MRFKLYNKFLELSRSKDDNEVLKDFTKEDLYLCDKLLDEIGKTVLSPEPNLNRIRKNIESKNIKKSSVLFSFIRYAAVIIPIMGISLLFYYIYNQSLNYQENNSSVTEIKDDFSNNVKLILDNGKKLDLTNHNSGEIYASNSVLVSKDSSQTISYKNIKDTIERIKFNTLVVPMAAEYSIELSDGTIVQLNSESKLKFPILFNGKDRIVYLEGEAYFRVKRNINKPFIVKVKDANIQVLGTSFNVNAYKETEAITTTLVEGSVKVNYKNDGIILKPNQQSIISNGKISCKNVDVNKYISHIMGKFYFEDKNMERVMISIERWYGVNVFFQNKSAKEIMFSGVIKKYLPLEKTLKLIEEACGVHIRLKGKNVYIKN